MGIRRIDWEICTGCGICIDSCPMDTIRMNEERKKPMMRYPKSCECCYLCILDCPVNAIS